MFSVAHPELSLRNAAVIYQHSKTLHYLKTVYVSQGEGISGQSQAEQEFISIPNSKYHPIPKLDTPFPNKDRGEIWTWSSEADTVLG